MTLPALAWSASARSPLTLPTLKHSAIVRACALGVTLLLGTTPLEAEDAWTVIERFRSQLEVRSPFSARFDQTYLPDGFSTGETEGGRFSLSLPECLRWDYDDPYPKSFILCGDVFHYWNADEPQGHREEIDALSQPGLDLVELSYVDEVGNRTTFRISDYRGGLEHGTFNPPEDVEWVEN